MRSISAGPVEQVLVDQLQPNSAPGRLPNATPAGRVWSALQRVAIVPGAFVADL